MEAHYSVDDMSINNPDADDIMMNNMPEEISDGEEELVVYPSNEHETAVGKLTSQLAAMPAEAIPQPTTTTNTESADDDEMTTVSQRYLSKIARPMHKSGNTTISYAEAKLFGLLDKDGNIKTDKIRPTNINDITAKLESKSKSRAFAMSKPRPPPPPPKPEPVQPLKSKAAQAAMADPGCGYDFLDKYTERGNFLETLSAQDESRKAKSKGADDHMKANYEAKLDKLACPSCRREQSFDEWFQKKRLCSRCSERFRQINVSNATSYIKRMEAAQKKKDERLAKIDFAVYGRDGVPNIDKKVVPTVSGPGNNVAHGIPKSDQEVLHKLTESNKVQSALTKKLFEKQYQGGEMMFDSKQKQEQLFNKSRKK